MTLDDPLKAADKAYAAHDYRIALVEYRKALVDPQAKASRDRIRVRIGLSLAKLKKFAEARDALKAAVAEATTPRAKTIALTERGVLALTMPGYYYEKDGKKSWGNWVQGATYHWIQNDLLKSGLVDLMAARSALEDQKKAFGKPVKEVESVQRKAFAQLHWRTNLELASALERVRDSFEEVPKEWAGQSVFGDAKHYEERLALTYDDVMDLQKSLGFDEGYVLAGYLRAMAFRRHLERHGRVACDTKRRITFTPHGKDRTAISLPDAWNPLKTLEKIRPLVKETGLGADVLMAMSRIQSWMGLFVDSVASSKKLVEQYPTSVLVGDAKELIQELTHPRLTVEVGTMFMPGTEPIAKLNTRNIPNLTLRIVPFDLASVMESDSALKDDDLDWSQAKTLVQAKGREALSGEVIASMKHQTPDKGHHQWHNEELSLPVTASGAYVVEATSGDTVFRDLFVISKLSMLQTVDDQKTIVFTVDAESGAPVGGVEAVVRHEYWRKGLMGRYRAVRLVRGTTDAKGVFTAPHPAPEDSAGRSITVAGKSPTGEFALTQPAWGNVRSKSRERVIAYLMTDRPVYRPGHTVNIAAMMRARLGETLRNLAVVDLGCEIRDPKGTVIFKEAVKTDSAGSFDASITLGAEPPLGAYHVQVRHNGRRIRAGSFRVEEYKKPEFKVSISGPQNPTRLGATGSATIHGDYYFGAPVDGGVVEYRVFRERFWPSFRRNEPYRELYGSIPRNVDPSDRGSNRELVTRGQGVLDSEGKLVIEWSTSEIEKAYPKEDSRFVIQADVTDSSRRTISGALNLPITRTAFQASVTSTRGFWAAGETASFEVQTQTPFGSPVSVAGMMKVYRVTEKTVNSETTNVVTEIFKEAVQTDERGMVQWRYVADEAGKFLVSFQATDEWGELVRTDSPIWVHGQDWNARGFQMKNLEIITDKVVYEPGETAMLMVNSNFENSSVLVAMVANNTVLRHEVVRLNGKTAVMSLPINRELVPNVHIEAYTIRNGAFFQARREILVPPTSQLLDVDLAFDKQVYLPGEKGKVKVSVKDENGKPAPAHVVMSCLDASLLYIQQDQTLDIRRFFYGNRRSHRVRQMASVTYVCGGYLARHLKWESFERRGWLPAWNNRPGRISRLIEGKSLLVDIDLPTAEVEEEADGQLFGGREVEGSWSGGLLEDAPAEASKARGRRSSRGRAGRLESGLAAPAASARPMAKMSMDSELGEDKLAPSPDQELVEPEIRTDFRDTAVWAPDVVCDENGEATVTVPFPQSLTAWRAKAIAFTPDTKVGTASVEVATSKDVLVRLQAPRFFVEGDRIVLSAMVDNRTNRELDAEVSIQIEGETLRLAGDTHSKIRLSAGSSQRVDWWTDVIASGEAKITVKALTSTDSDAMQMSFPVSEWGAQKTLTETVVMDKRFGTQVSNFTFDVPSSRKVNSARLKFNVQPSLALTLLDALPYLMEYPYGCTEQTVSRFIPAVACAATLKASGTSLEEIAAARRNLPKAQQQGKKDAVLTDSRLADIVRVGLRRLKGMQNGDGGYSWWKGGRSSVYLTSYVLFGLSVGKEAGVDVDQSQLDRARKWLSGRVDTLETSQSAAYVAWVLARTGDPDSAKKLINKLFPRRDDLGTYSKALLASACARAGRMDDAKTIISNLHDFVQTDEANGTLHWNTGARRWRWWNSPIEANAAVLDALLEVDPKHPSAAPLVKWLVRNRQGNRWSNTRDTAWCILALTKYAKRTGELDPSYALVITAANQTKTFNVTKQNLFAFDNTFTLKGDAIPSGPLQVRVAQKGDGAAYVTASLEFFTQEDHIKGAGHELFVQRSFQSVKEEEREVEANGKKTTRLVDVFTPLSEGAQLAAGEMVEVHLTIDAKNDYSYILLEDMKISGFEPLKLRSGSDRQNGICSNIELRDNRTAFFITHLQQGTHELTYRLRATAPGTLRALPARIEAMYAPTFRGISDSHTITITELKRL